MSSPRRIAILGTRGIPARYGGFETLAEEIGPRLADAGHDVWVYSRRGCIGPLDDRNRLARYRGVTVRVLPAPPGKYLETVGHTLLSAVDAPRRGFDAVLLCNAANAPAIPLLKMAGARVVVNVDGVEWRRRKWGPIGRAWHRLGARMTARLADVIVVDSRTLQPLWREGFGAESTYIPYGAPTGPVAGTSALSRLGLEPRGYVLYVSRFEPENNPDLVIEAFRRVDTGLRLVVVGRAAYDRRLGRRVEELAAEDPRVLLPGTVYGRPYAELQSHAFCYVQASEIGGTHPALLEAMGYGGCVVVNDIPEHREVIADAGLVYRFNDAVDLAGRLQELVDDPRRADELRSDARARVRERYDWDRVCRGYEDILGGT